MTAGQGPADVPTPDATVPPSGPVFMVCWTKCWPCQFDQHEGGPYTWADADDIEHAAATGQTDPSSQVCGCWCAKGPVLAPPIPDGPDMDAPGSIPPCPVCGEAGACGYDAEGRPMIHTDYTEDDDDD